MKRKSLKHLVYGAILLTAFSYNTKATFAAPKEIHAHRPMIMWDYYKVNYTEEGNIRFEPEKTTFTTRQDTSTDTEIPYLNIEDTDLGEDIIIDVDSEYKSWLMNIYKIEKVDEFTDNPNMNESLMFKLEDNKITLLKDSIAIQRNGRFKIKIYSTGSEPVVTSIHIVKDSPTINIVAGFEPVTDVDILFELKNFSYATQNPVYEVQLNGEKLKGDCEEYHVFSSLIRLENDGVIKEPGNYELRIKMNGYKDAVLNFNVAENDGSYIAPDYVFPDTTSTHTPSAGSSSGVNGAAVTVDAVTSSSLSTGSSSGSDTGSSGGGGKMINANLVFDFDLLANAQILKQLGFETQASKEVLAYYYTSIVDAATIEGETRIVNWNSFITKQAEAKVSGEFLTFQEYINSPSAEDYLDRPYWQTALVPFIIPLMAII